MFHSLKQHQILHVSLSYFDQHKATGTTVFFSGKLCQTLQNELCETWQHLPHKLQMPQKCDTKSVKIQVKNIIYFLGWFLCFRFNYCFPTWGLCGHKGEAVEAWQLAEKIFQSCTWPDVCLFLFEDFVRRVAVPLVVNLFHLELLCCKFVKEWAPSHYGFSHELDFKVENQLRAAYIGRQHLSQSGNATVRKCPS